MTNGKRSSAVAGPRRRSGSDGGGQSVCSSTPSCLSPKNRHPLARLCLNALVNGTVVWRRFRPLVRDGRLVQTIGCARRARTWPELHLGLDDRGQGDPSTLRQAPVCCRPKKTITTGARHATTLARSPRRVVVDNQAPTRAVNRPGPCPSVDGSTVPGRRGDGPRRRGSALLGGFAAWIRDRRRGVRQRRDPVLQVRQARARAVHSVQIGRGRERSDNEPGAVQRRSQM